MTSRLSRSLLTTWSPLIGDRYGHKQAILGPWYVLAITFYVLGICLIAIVGLTIQSTFTPLIISVVIAILTWINLSIWMIRIDRLGRVLRRDLAAAGIHTHRRAPLQSVYLYKKWLRRNNLTAEQVVAILG